MIVVFWEWSRLKKTNNKQQQIQTLKALKLRNLDRKQRKISFAEHGNTNHMQNMICKIQIMLINWVPRSLTSSNDVSVHWIKYFYSAFNTVTPLFLFLSSLNKPCQGQCFYDLGVAVAATMAFQPFFYWQSSSALSQVYPSNATSFMILSIHLSHCLPQYL